MWWGLDFHCLCVSLFPPHQPWLQLSFLGTLMHSHIQNLHLHKQASSHTDITEVHRRLQALRVHTILLKIHIKPTVPHVISMLV